MCAHETLDEHTFMYISIRVQQYTDFDSRFSVLMEMLVTTISFVSFRLGPWNGLGIDDRAVPVKGEIHKRAILVQIVLL